MNTPEIDLNKTDRRAKKTVILFLILILLTAGSVLAATLIIYFDSPASTPANSVGNIMNGARVVTGDERVYYTDSEGVFTFSPSDPSKQTIISNIPADRLFYQNKKFYYVQNGVLYSSFFDGSLRTEIFKGFDDIQISGNWFFYLKDGTLHKIRQDGKHETNLKIKTSKFYIFSQSLYFLNEDGIYSVKTNGQDKKAMTKADINQFMFDGSYMFYKTGAAVKSQLMADSNQGKTIGDCTAFNVTGERFVYSDKNGIFVKNLDKKENPKKLSDAEADEIYISDEYIYYSKGKGAINQVRFDGTEAKLISKNATK